MHLSDRAYMSHSFNRRPLGLGFFVAAFVRFGQAVEAVGQG